MHFGCFCSHWGLLRPAKILANNQVTNTLLRACGWTPFQRSLSLSAGRGQLSLRVHFCKDSGGWELQILSVMQYCSGLAEEKLVMLMNDFQDSFLRT